MNKNDNIEELFRNAFDGYEEQVNPKVWDAVSKQISGPSASPSSSGTSAGAAKGGALLSGKIGAWIAGAALVAATAGGYLIFREPAANAPASAELSVPVSQDQPVTNETLPGTAVPSESNLSAEPKQESTSSEKHTPITQHTGTAAVTNGTSASPSAGTASGTQPSELNRNSTSSPAATPATASVPAAPAANQASNSGTTLPNTIPPTTFDRYVPIITASPSSGYAPLKVRLSFYGDATSVLWNIGDGSETLTVPVTEHTFNNPGTYTVELTTTDPEGVRHVTRTQIEVKSPSVVDNIPNVFTPNGDGLNDRFEITGSEIRQVDAAIFDKSGRQIYRWTGADGGWDGRLLSGEIAREGTYFYVIFARGADERTYQFKGTVTLIR